MNFTCMWNWQWPKEWCKFSARWPPQNYCRICRGVDGSKITIKKSLIHYFVHRIKYLMNRDIHSQILFLCRCTWVNCMSLKSSLPKTFKMHPLLSNIDVSLYPNVQVSGSKSIILEHSPQMYKTVWTNGYSDTVRLLKPVNKMPLH